MLKHPADDASSQRVAAGNPHNLTICSVVLGVSRCPSSLSLELKGEGDPQSRSSTHYGGFEIVLFMAGGGAYTAGVVAFLIKALDHWHEG